MKRGKPLKRTPLKRGDKQLKRTPLNRGESTLKSNTPLNKQSKKMSATYVKRRKLVKDRLGEGAE